ncbi:MAG TPA: hypothetical protein VHG30_02345 [Microvirga sp.]|nr:hypothetical protein [Microvirga sp.]
MTEASGDADDQVRAHVRKVLERLTARQREKRAMREPPPVAVSVEVEREQDRPTLTRDAKRPA